MIRRLLLPLPPSANAYWRKDRFGTLHVSTEGKAYKAEVAKLVSAEPTALPIAIETEVHRAMKRGDLDNRLKVLLDALKGLAFVDDEQVLDITARRFDDPRKLGEVTVQVTELFDAANRQPAHRWCFGPDARGRMEAARERLKEIGNERRNAEKRKPSKKQLRDLASPSLFGRRS